MDWRWLDWLRGALLGALLWAVLLLVSWQIAGALGQ